LLIDFLSISLKILALWIHIYREIQRKSGKRECKKDFGPWGRKNPQRFPRRKGCFRTLVMGPALPEKELRWPEPPWLDTLDELGLGLDLKAVMLWETPSAKMNCSRSSMLVRPLAGWSSEQNKNWVHEGQTQGGFSESTPNYWLDD
jgi:hypothetical protein